MKIDPKTFVLDANERAVLSDALAALANNLAMSIHRRKESPRYMGRGGLSEDGRRELDHLETLLARAQDLREKIA